MASINVFPSCRMRAFAAMVTREFGVQVRMRGREICVRLSKPPVIFLPNLEAMKASFSLFCHYKGP